LMPQAPVDRRGAVTKADIILKNATVVTMDDQFRVIPGGASPSSAIQSSGSARRTRSWPPFPRMRRPTVAARR
jgi:hypothetical protein